MISDLNRIPIFASDSLGYWELLPEPDSLLKRLRFRFERACRNVGLIDPPWNTLPYRRFIPDTNIYRIVGVGLVAHSETIDKIRRITS
jgi:hypothetical protein